MAIANAKPGDLDLRPFIKMVGVERVVEAVGPKQMIDPAGAEKVADALGIERYVASLSPENRQRLKDLLQ